MSRLGSRATSVLASLIRVTNLFFTIRRNPMKIIAHIMLLVVALSTLAACGEQGVGPSKPAKEAVK